MTEEECRSCIETLEKLNIVYFDRETYEIMILKWPDNNWTTSEKYISGVKKAKLEIKSEKINEIVEEKMQEPRLGPIYYS